MTKIAGSGFRIRIRIRIQDPYPDPGPRSVSGSRSTPICHGSATLIRYQPTFLLRKIYEPIYTTCKARNPCQRHNLTLPKISLMLLPEGESIVGSFFSGDLKRGSLSSSRVWEARQESPPRGTAGRSSPAARPPPPSSGDSLPPLCAWTKKYICCNILVFTVVSAEWKCTVFCSVTY